MAKNKSKDSAAKVAEPKSSKIEKASASVKKDFGKKESAPKSKAGKKNLGQEELLFPEENIAPASSRPEKRKKTEGASPTIEKAKPEPAPSKKEKIAKTEPAPVKVEKIAKAEPATAVAVAVAPDETSAGDNGQKKKRVYETAESMASRQRSISVSEFFTKNRHLLGFDNPRKALLTTIKEGVDNSLDACEEAGILPDIKVEIHELAEDRFRIVIEDNGPGIIRREIPNIFGKLLYGSKFHRLKMSRGQQGIGISAAGMYGMLTTGKPVVITSRTGVKHPAHYFEIQIDTSKNKPNIICDRETEWEKEHGTRVEIELAGSYVKGKQSIDEYLRQTVIANPHLSLSYLSPTKESLNFVRVSEDHPPFTEEIKPHPYGVELGTLQQMIKDSQCRGISSFMKDEFSRVSPRIADEICEKAGLEPRMSLKKITRENCEALIKSILNTKIMNPPTNCVAPIGEARLENGLRQVVPAEFYAASTRPPQVYRGNPFLIEAAIAFGGPEMMGDSPARLLRLANRVPLLYQQGACVITQCVTDLNWRNYGLQQPKGALPVAPLTIVVHVASVWVPFTSESKEAVACYPEIEKEIYLALQECGRKLKIHLSHQRREAETERKRSYIEMYIPHICFGLRELIGFSQTEEKSLTATLENMLEKSKDAPTKDIVFQDAASDDDTEEVKPAKGKKAKKSDSENGE